MKRWNVRAYRRSDLSGGFFSIVTCLSAFGSGHDFCVDEFGDYWSVFLTLGLSEVVGNYQDVP